MAEKNVLNRESLKKLIELIQRNYLSDGRPWVIGYSGGKDSTCVLQLTWIALSKLPKEQLSKDVYVISSDTLVEAPLIVNQIAQNHRLIIKAAEKQGLPFKAHMVVPQVTDTFWANIIGRGYPVPYSNFRWCTDRMKIQPTTRFIEDKVTQYGEVVILLGARRQESSTRAQVMENRKDLGNRLSRHKDLANAFVFTPVEDWSEQDVWTYLLNSKNPWGANNKELKTMYLNAQSGECPLVIDKSTPSCGGGRFGCWTCTVVNKDKSMEALVENGEDWMEPMMDFRISLSNLESWLYSRDKFKKEFDLHTEALKQALQGEPELSERLRVVDKGVKIKNLSAQEKAEILKKITPEQKTEFIKINCLLDSRSVYRDTKRRNGRIELFISKEGEARLTWGPYRLETRKEILKGLLEQQAKVFHNLLSRPEINKSDVKLITEAELHQLRKMWRFDEGDWEDSIPEIYEGVSRNAKSDPRQEPLQYIEWLRDDTSGLGGKEYEILAEVCEEFELSERMIMELFDLEKKHQGVGKRYGIYNKLGKILKKDWRLFDQPELELGLEESTDED